MKIVVAPLDSCEINDLVIQSHDKYQLRQHEIEISYYIYKSFPFEGNDTINQKVATICKC